MRAAPHDVPAAPDEDLAPAAPAPSAGVASKILRNAGALVGGKAFGGFLSIAYLAIAARTLGPTEMGYLVLASAYALAAAGIARFQSWQAVIRFGAPLAEVGDTTTLKALLRFTIRLDLASAVISVVLALTCAPLAARVFDWPPAALPWVYLYCASTPFLIAATPTGVLRLFDRYKVLGWQLLSMPLIRFFGALIVWAADGGLLAFMAVWILSGVVDGATLWWLGWRELSRRNLKPDIFAPAALRAPDAWRKFMIKTNIASTFDLAANNLPILIVGAALGSAASAFLQISINLTNLIAHPANMLYNAAFPELTKTAITQGRGRMRAAAYRIVAFGLAAAAPVVALFIVFNDEAVRLVAGPGFAPAATVLSLMALTQWLRTSSIVLESASLAMGYATTTLAAQGLAAATQLIALSLLFDPLGVLAAPASMMIGFSAMIAAHVYRLHRGRSHWPWPTRSAPSRQ